MSTGEVIALISVALVFIFGVIGLLLRAIGVLISIRVELTSMRIEFGHVSRRVDKIERIVESEHGGGE